MEYFDDKQKQIINSWHEQAKKTDDEYMKFIANWIAFNAICYNLYSASAVIERAEIDRGKSKLPLVESRFFRTNKLIAENAELENKGEKWNLNISFPERIFLTIKKNIQKT